MASGPMCTVPYVVIISVCYVHCAFFSDSSDESSLATSPLRHRLPQSMKIVHEIMYKVEVLYVLCVLLIGRQRNQVRARYLEFTTVGLEKWVQLVTEIVKFLATVLLQYLLFGGLAWVSAMHNALCNC